MRTFLRSRCGNPETSHLGDVCHWFHRVVRSDDDAKERLVQAGLVLEEVLVLLLVLGIAHRGLGLEHGVAVVPAHNHHARLVDVLARLHLTHRVHLHRLLPLVSRAC